MKPLIQLLILMTLCVQSALGGGSISWEDVKSRITKTDPELVKVIENSFTVNRSGVGIRLGPSFGERHGERIAPYEFGAADKKTGGKCVLVIDESEDYEFTGRFKFVKKDVENEPHAEQTGTAQPATSSESKSEGSDKPQPESEGRSR